ncbi:aminotransferase class V-fold PLP-dependent enzyme [Nocardia sp. CA-290969]|uniref:aminotransferase class V-fold PLP-dependent enzyme n=1 Tax=Nocardia sp. CA-290969 TaxID=3239986 RepID=UPI003D8AAB41
MTAVLDRTGTLARVSGADLRVPLVQGGTRTYANFDYAASAPALAPVSDRVAELLPYYASVHRGAGYASRISTQCYEAARETVGRFLGCADDQVVVFTRNTTDALNLLAGCVPGDTVVLDIEHHANLLAWEHRGRRVVRAADTVAETLQRLAAELCAKPAALLAVTGASNVTGEVLPLDRLAELAHQCGARILVDAAQLAPHRRIDLRATGIDYLVLSGHKLYAPFGAGVLAGRRDWLDAAAPYLSGGGAVREVTVDSTEWAPAPQRHEAGSPNVLGAAALARACEVLTELGPEAEAHERSLTHRLRTGLAATRGVECLRIWKPDAGNSGSVAGGEADTAASLGEVDSVGIVAFTVDGFEPGQVAAYLSAEFGIGVRDGRFCAHPLLARLGIDAAVRASIGLGTTQEDIDRLLDAVAALVAHGPRWNYVCAAGRWDPFPETRPGLAPGTAAGAAPCAV